MTSARDLLPALRIRAFKATAWTRLAIPAAVLIVLFGLVAFLMLLWRDGGHPNVMVNEQIAPNATPAKLAASLTSAPAGAGAATATKTQEAKATASATPTIASRNEFTIDKTNFTFVIGPVRLRLLKTNLNRKTYDLSVLARRRALVHRNLKEGQPLWISRNRGEQPVEIVVSSIGKEVVSGYWEESGRPLQTVTRNRARP
ncbi:MAG TPA: hypothetical protein VHZ55_17810 [Bryobacteraceae bacterium]|nr:hypothetical protein [Bryobacteraceae bacterium]